MPKSSLIGSLKSSSIGGSNVKYTNIRISAVRIRIAMIVFESLNLINLLFIKIQVKNDVIAQDNMNIIISAIKLSLPLIPV